MEVIYRTLLKHLWLLSISVRYCPMACFRLYTACTGSPTSVFLHAPTIFFSSSNFSNSSLIPSFSSLPYLFLSLLLHCPLQGSSSSKLSKNPLITSSSARAPMTWLPGRAPAPTSSRREPYPEDRGGRRRSSGHLSVAAAPPAAPTRVTCRPSANSPLQMPVGWTITVTSTEVTTSAHANGQRGRIPSWVRASSDWSFSSNVRRHLQSRACLGALARWRSWKFWHRSAPCRHAGRGFEAAFEKKISLYHVLSIFMRSRGSIIDKADCDDIWNAA